MTRRILLPFALTALLVALAAPSAFAGPGARGAKKAKAAPVNVQLVETGVVYRPVPINAYRAKPIAPAYQRLALRAKARQIARAQLQLRQAQSKLNRLLRRGAPVWRVVAARKDVRIAKRAVRIAQAQRPVYQARRVRG